MNICRAVTPDEKPPENTGPSCPLQDTVDEYEHDKP